MMSALKKVCLVDTSLLLAILSLTRVDGAGLSIISSASPVSSTTAPRTASSRSLFDVDDSLRGSYDPPHLDPANNGDPKTEQDLEVPRAKRDDFLSSALSSKSGFLESLRTAYGEISAQHAAYPEPEKKSFNIFGFKKAIFGTLVQALKAITGGVIALKGQLIKVTGHITATKGKVLATKGDVISELGRHIASKALAQPFYHYEGYGHSGISAPSAPAYGYPAYSSYHAYPTAPAYGPPAPAYHSYPSGPHYSDYHRLARQSKPGYGPSNPGASQPPQAAPAGQLPPGVQAGLLVLKPVQVPVGGHTHGPPPRHADKTATSAPPSGYSSVHPSGYSHPPPPPAHLQQSPYSVAPQIFPNPNRYPANSGAYQVNANQESFENYESQEAGRYQYPSQPSQNNFHDPNKRSPIKRIFDVPIGPGFADFTF